MILDEILKSVHEEGELQVWDGCRCIFDGIKKDYHPENGTAEVEEQSIRCGDTVGMNVRIYRYVRIKNNSPYAENDDMVPRRWRME